MDALAPTDFSASTILATVALGLMVIVSVGVLYLTAYEWRDRRRRKQDDVKR